MVIIMKILLITDEIWNDNIYTNNTLTNWFEGFPAEFANIYLTAGVPYNKCCNKYYQITDKMMLCSILTQRKAGRRVEYNKDGTSKEDSFPEKENKAFYFFMKLIATEAIRLLRDWIWLIGNYNITEIDQFIKDFNPDIIFSLRPASRKLLRFERMISGLTNCPMITFTGDDEYSLLQLRFSPIYWYRKLKLREDMRKTIPYYKKYYMLSERQAQLYHQLFHIDTEVLRKGGNFTDEFHQKELHTPIKLVYTGKLYCNRWKTLRRIKVALDKININETKMVLQIYTKDRISKRRRKLLDDGRNSFLMPPANAEALTKVYQQADLVLHVEAFDRKSRWITRYSFSTKIIDYLSSSCAVAAICPAEHAGYQYLKGKDAAICISDLNKLDSCLKKIALQPQILYKYQKNAWDCGTKYHRQAVVREKIYQDIEEICGKSGRKSLSQCE